MNSSHLILRCIIALWEISLVITVVREVIVHQIPSPALIVAPQQGHVSLALQGGILRGDPHHGHRSERTFPPHLPSVPTLAEPPATPGSVRALRHRVPVKCEPIWFDINIPRAIARVEGVEEGPQFGLVARDFGEEVPLPGIGGDFPDALDSPDERVLIVQAVVPRFADGGAIEQVGKVQVRKNQLQNSGWKAGG